MKRKFIKFLAIFVALLPVSVLAEDEPENDPINFHIDIPQEDPIHIGQEFRIYYRAEQEMDDFQKPTLDPEVFHIIESAVTYHSTEKTESVDDGKSEKNWAGFYYVVSAIKPGIFPLPVVQASFEGKKVTCTADTVQIFTLNDYFMDCEITVSPEKPTAGEKFELKLTLSQRLDKTPTPNFGRLKLLTKRPKLSAYIVDDAGIYTYTFDMMADKQGRYRIPPFEVYVAKKKFMLRGKSVTVQRNSKKKK